MNTEIKSDFDFFTYYIPNYYVTHDMSVTNMTKPEKWRCRSNKGMSESDFENFFKAVKYRWPGRFLEIDHTTCTNHADFTIYLKPQ
jgi:hypothetical protein